MRRGNRLGGADPRPASDSRGHCSDPGLWGVAAFALQFARVLGARVIATTSTAEKAERLKALGPPM
jgi:hypothetical protein